MQTAVTTNFNHDLEQAQHEALQVLRQLQREAAEPLNDMPCEEEVDAFALRTRRIDLRFRIAQAILRAKPREPQQSQAGAQPGSQAAAVNHTQPNNKATGSATTTVMHERTAPSASPTAQPSHSANRTGPHPIADAPAPLRRDPGSSIQPPSRQAS